ncbi:hypothetical protein OG613_45415 (plasmid) [Streptomyces sp. NBC_00015]|uniref:hypothetical protein n=1 Tax=unclassified Streptomyces TaxID=2593676 RepID=UPI002F907330
MFAGLAVEHLRLLRPQFLPCLDRLAQQRIDGLGERGAGLVGGDVQQADGVSRQYLVGVAGDRGPLVLPADAAHAKSRDLVIAQATEQPGQGQHPEELERIAEAVEPGRQIVGADVEPGPQQFGPDVIGYHPRVGAEHRRDGSGRRQRAYGVEPSGYPLPFLKVAEESAGRGEVARLAVRRDRLTCPFLVTGDSLDAVPTRSLSTAATQAAQVWRVY